MSGYGWEDKFGGVGSGGNNQISPYQNNNTSNQGKNQDLQIIDPQTYISLARKGMGMIEGYKFDKGNRQEVAKYAGEMASLLLSTMKESAEHQMMLNLDVEKKHRLKAYQEEIHQIDRSIEHATKEAVRQVTDYFVEHITSMRVAKKGYSDRFKNMVSSGELFQEDADEINSLVGNLNRTVTGDALDRLMLIFKSYGISYERTVSLLTSRLK